MFYALLFPSLRGSFQHKQKVHLPSSSNAFIFPCYSVPFSSQQLVLPSYFSVVRSSPSSMEREGAQLLSKKGLSLSSTDAKTQKFPLRVSCQNAAPFGVLHTTEDWENLPGRCYVFILPSSEVELCKIHFARWKNALKHMENIGKTQHYQ